MSTWSRQWIAAFLGFLFVFGAWALASPFDGPADEVQHVIRAVGVVSGEVAPDPVIVKDGMGNDGMGAYQTVPRGLLSHAWCWGFSPGRSAACERPLTGGPLESVPTSAGRYNPAYYAIVGWPLKFAPNWTGLVIARLVSAALSAALLACAFTVLLRWSRHGLMLAGLLAASTPMLAHLAGAVNPNGLEIAAGIGLFAGGIPLLLGPARGPKGPLIALVGVSGILLATLRSLGPVWLCFGLFALLVPQTRAMVKDLWSRRAVRWWGGGIVLALVLSAAWIVLMKTGSVVPPANGGYNYSTGQAILMYFDKWGIYLQGIVGVSSWFDTVMPQPFYWAWISAAASLIIFALVVGDRRDRWRIFVLFVGGVIVPGVLQVSQANLTGFIIGGRYMLPLLVGMPLLAAFVVERRLLNAQQSWSLSKLFCILLVPAHFVLLVYTMARWQKGNRGDPQLGHLNPLTGSWHPPSGSLAPVILMVVGSVLLGWLFWNGPRWLRGTDEPDESRGGVDSASRGRTATVTV